MMNFFHNLPWSLLLIACLTIGLAPFQPPHVVEKLEMLAQGTLIRPLDWFDLLLHGAPWLVLVLKVLASLLAKGTPPATPGG